MNEPVSTNGDGLLEPGFTPREKAVLRLLADGYTFWEIAQKLNIAFGTIQQHVANIRFKLGAREGQ